MDETKLGEAIGRSMSEATAKMMPEMADAMTKSVMAAQTGVYVEVSPAELATELSNRAKRLRTRAEEIAAAPIEVADLLESVPPYMRTAREDEAGVRQQGERETKKEQQRRRTQIESLMTEVARLDFVATHLPSDRETIRMDRHELDDLLFDERKPSHGVIY